MRSACEGLERRSRTATADDVDFGTWMRDVFGDGHHPPLHGALQPQGVGNPGAAMSAGWIAERVSVVDYERARDNVREQRDDLAWGPNNTFVFPAAGRDRRDLPAAGRSGSASGPDPLRAARGRGVPRDARTLRLADGERLAYDALVSTMPLDRLVHQLERLPAGARAPAAASSSTTASTWSASATRRRWPTTGRGCTSPTRRCRSTAPPTSPSTRPPTCPAQTPAATART